MTRSPTAMEDRWSPRRRGCSAGRGAGSGPVPVVPAQAGVFRGSCRCTTTCSSGPRAGGGVPATGAAAAAGLEWSPAGGGVPEARKAVPPAYTWSPRRRGCSGAPEDRVRSRCVVPAQAGVFRPPRLGLRSLPRGPRAGGGVPYCELAARRLSAWSPRRRGCSAARQFRRDLGVVVPAQAGVFRGRRGMPLSPSRGPRAGGGVPASTSSSRAAPSWSPRRRGCSVVLRQQARTLLVVPAQAGMFRHLGLVLLVVRSGPRAGGGVPSSWVTWATRYMWSPRRRGCSGRAAPASQGVLVVPAQAGVFPRHGELLREPSRGPRAGGGVPPSRSLPWPTRGWSQRRRGCSAVLRSRPGGAGVVPAQAGVFWSPCGSSLSSTCGRRAGGGVPEARKAVPPAYTWSPRRRGCSGRVVADGHDRGVVPAQAGVFRALGSAYERARRGPSAGGGVPGLNSVNSSPSAWSPVQARAYR